MEARYVEAGSMSIFWTQNPDLKTTSLARDRTRAAAADLPGLFQTFFTPRGSSCAHAHNLQTVGCGSVAPALLHSGTKQGLGGTGRPKSGSVGAGTRWVLVLLYVILHPVWVLQCQ